MAGRKPSIRRRRRIVSGDASAAPPFTAAVRGHEGDQVDLKRRRDQLTAQVAELQFDLGGLVYEMAIRNQIRVDLIVKRAAIMQNADAELGEVERILQLEQTSTAGVCPHCGAPHSSGAGYCWQCGQAILEQVPSSAIGSSVVVTPPPANLPPSTSSSRPAVTPPPPSIAKAQSAEAPDDAPTRTAL